MENKKYTSVDDIFKEIDDDIAKRPIYYWFYRQFWALVRLSREIWSNVIGFIQRGKRGWAVSDTWELGTYLAEVIHGSVSHLNKTKHGYPSTLNPMTGDYDFDMKRWQYILNEIIWTFDVAKNIGGTIYYMSSKNWTEESYNSMVNIVQRTNNKYPDLSPNRVLTFEETKRYEQGLKYFTEYLDALWD